MEEAAELRVRLAAAQQKADTLQEPLSFLPLFSVKRKLAQELQSDIAKQRSDLEAEKLQLKQQAVQVTGSL